MGKNKCKSIKVSEIWKKMGNPMPVEREMGPNQHNMENYGDLQPIAQSMKPTLWVLSEDLSFGLLPNIYKWTLTLLTVESSWAVFAIYFMRSAGFLCPD